MPGTVRKRFGLLVADGSQPSAASEELTAPLTGVDSVPSDVAFALSLFEAVAQRLKLLDEVFIHLLDESSATVVLKNAVPLRQHLDRTISSIRDKMSPTHRVPQRHTVTPGTSAGRSGESPKSAPVDAPVAEDTTIIPPATSSGRDIRPVPRPPSEKRQATRRPVTGGEVQAAPLVADMQREKDRAKLRDERLKNLQQALRAKENELHLCNQENESLGLLAQKTNKKFQVKEKQLRSLEALSRETEQELVRRISFLEDKLDSGQSDVAGTMVDSAALNELENALSRLAKTQQELDAKTKLLNAQTKKSRLLKDKISQLQRSEENAASKRLELEQLVQAAELRSERVESRSRMFALQARKAEDTVAAKQSASAEMQELIQMANLKLKERDEQEMSLTSKMRKALAAIAQKEQDMDRLKQLLAVAHAENENAIELEKTVAAEKRARIKAKKESDRAEAKLATCEAKLAKRILEIEELRADLAASEAVVAAAEQKVAQSKQAMLQKDAVVDKAAVDSAARLKALQDAETEIRELHFMLARHDRDLTDRDRKVDEAETAVARARALARQAIDDVKKNATSEIKAVKDKAQREVQRIKSESLADDMMQASAVAVDEANAEAKVARTMLERSVAEVEKYKNVSVAVLKHLDVVRVEKQQLTLEVRHCHMVQAEMLAAVTESAALKSELDSTKAKLRSFRLRHAVAMTKLEGLEQQIKVLRDDEAEIEAALENSNLDAEDAKRRLMEEDRKVYEIIEGDKDHLRAKIKEWMQMKVDIDKIKGQKNKAIEVAAAADALSARLQNEMIESCSAVCLSRLVADVEVAQAEEAQNKAVASEQRALVLSNELRCETRQCLEMHDMEKTRCSRLTDSLQREMLERAHLEKALHHQESAVAAIKLELASCQDGASSLQIEVDEKQTLITAGHAREAALRKGIHNIRSVRVVDYILARPELYLTKSQGVDALPSPARTRGSWGEHSSHHVPMADQVVESVRIATSAYEKVIAWRNEVFCAGNHSAPTPEEVHQWAIHLDIDPSTEQSLLWIAEEALWAPVTTPWVELQRNVEGELLEDRLYYSNTQTKTESPEHPLNRHYRTLLETLRSIDSVLLDSFNQMRVKLAKTPPTEMVREGWQYWVDDFLCQLVRLAVCRHQAIQAHYEHIASLLCGSAEIMMSSRLRLQRSIGTGKRKKKPESRPAIADQQIPGMEFVDGPLPAGENETARLEGAELAKPSLLRVRGGEPQTGSLLLGGGTATANAGDSLQVQWYRSKRSEGVVIDDTLSPSELTAVDFEVVPHAQSLSYIPTALDVGRLLRLCVSTAKDGRSLDSVFACVGDGVVKLDASVEAKVQRAVDAGVVDLPLLAARSGAKRTLFVTRGVGSRVELRDATRLLLSRPLASVDVSIGYGFPNSIVLIDVQTGMILSSENEAHAQEDLGLGVTECVVSNSNEQKREPIVLQAPSSAIRDEVLLSVLKLKLK